LHDVVHTTVSVLSGDCCKVFLLHMMYEQGRRKQSADCQARLDVDGEAANNSCAKCAPKFWT